MINNVKTGNVIIIGHLDNDVSKYLSESSKYGLLEGFEVCNVDNNNVYIYGKQKQLSIPYSQIYKVFDNYDLYMKWRDSYLEKNERKIGQLAMKMQDYDINRKYAPYMSIKYYYDDAIKRYVYNDFIYSKNIANELFINKYFNRKKNDLEQER